MIERFSVPVNLFAAIADDEMTINYESLLTGNSTLEEVKNKILKFGNLIEQIRDEIFNYVELAQINLREFKEKIEEFERKASRLDDI